MPHKHCVNCGYHRDVTYFESEDAAYCRACLSVTQPIDSIIAYMSSSELINCVRNTVRQALGEKIVETNLLPEIRKMTRFILENFNHEIQPGESSIDTAIRLLKEYKDETVSCRGPT